MNKGAYATGRQIKRASGMFSAFKEEYDKARKGRRLGRALWAGAGRQRFGRRGADLRRGPAAYDFVTKVKSS